MSVEFDQENNFNKNFNRSFSNSNSSKMNAFLIKKGYAKNEKQANMILLGISLISIFITIVILNMTVFGGSFFNKKTTNQNAKIIKEYQAQGLKGKALFDKLEEDRKAGIIK